MDLNGWWGGVAGAFVVFFAASVLERLGAIVKSLKAIESELAGIRARTGSDDRIQQDTQLTRQAAERIAQALAEIRYDVGEIKAGRGGP